MSVQEIVDCTGHITGGHKKDDNVFAESLFDTMNELDPDKKFEDLSMFDGAIVGRKANQLKVVYPMLSCIVGAEHT